MANFTFDADDEARRVNSADGNAGNQVNGSGPGGGSGKGSVTNGDSGIKDGNSGLAREANDSFDPEAPLGRLANGQPRKRRFSKRNRAGTASNTDAAGGTTDASGKARLDIKNDRDKVKTNIAGLHAMAAVLTKQPIWNLKDEEATALTNSLCDVADHHGMDLIGAGGSFALYASLATSVYMIYVPRFVYLKHLKASDEAQPINPGEYREETTTRARGFKMDFSNDRMN